MISSIVVVVDVVVFVVVVVVVVVVYNVAKVRYVSNQLIHFVDVAFVFEIAISSDVVVVVFGVEDDVFCISGCLQIGKDDSCTKSTHFVVAFVVKIVISSVLG